MHRKRDRLSATATVECHVEMCRSLQLFSGFFSPPHLSSRNVPRSPTTRYSTSNRRSLGCSYRTLASPSFSQTTFTISSRYPFSRGGALAPNSSKNRPWLLLAQAVSSLNQLQLPPSSVITCINSSSTPLFVLLFPFTSDHLLPPQFVRSLPPRPTVPYCCYLSCERPPQHSLRSFGQQH